MLCHRRYGSWSYTWHLLRASSTPWDKRRALDFRQAPAIRSQTIVLTPPFKHWFEIGTPVQQKVELREADTEGLTLGK